MIKIKVKEASPRKFRADPKTRGVGGKWGPVDVNKTYQDATRRRKDVAEGWEKFGCKSKNFCFRFYEALKASGLPWTTSQLGSGNGFDAVSVNGDLVSMIGVSVPTIYRRIDHDPLNTQKATVGDRFLFNLVNKIEDDFAVEIYFTSQGDDMTSATCDIFHASMDGGYEAHKDDGTWPSVQECIDMTLNTLREITAYIKKMAPAIQREIQRPFRENKTLKEAYEKK